MNHPKENPATPEEDNSIKKKLICSFCGKTQDDVTQLIAGPTVYICNECVELCNEIIKEEGSASPNKKTPKAKAIRYLKRLLKPGSTIYTLSFLSNFHVLFVRNGKIVDLTKRVNEVIPAGKHTLFHVEKLSFALFGDKRRIKRKRL